MENKDTTIYAKLGLIQCELKAPKNLYNSFGKYKYRNAEGICEAVKPLLKDYGCSLTVKDEVLLIGDRYYIKATATLTDVESGNSVEATALAREEDSKKGMDASQVTGSTSSYARKYCLNGLFLLDDTKDPDSEEYQQTGKTEMPKNQNLGTIDGGQEYIASLTQASAKKGVGLGSITKKYKVKDVKEMTFEQYIEAMQLLEKYPDK